ncbi:SCP-like extracellular [Stanieria cyanosphaera PCC 7437]|uniref:SCP-like extracellular n=1 Tax=Stanieria cyanosphaera (strain ATCC 29371 / PCC 7437) TaxID=111780 RepID=K9XR69_STAC7|nr:CAP domain-containing protein [Stanieria cyanosphaera]AFZ34162.1 SCP-like extracellular [Stanieria cyanosphaera PCC 7437]
MSSELINQVLELTNAERTKAGLKPLKLNSKLVNAAQNHSKNMAEDDFFSHTGEDGSSVSDRVQDAGYQYSRVGENIAAGQKTAEQVVQGWMNSPGHRANILNSNFTEIGIGYEYLENDTGSVNYNYYWTQVFGNSLSNNSNENSNQENVLEEENNNSTPIKNDDLVEDNNQSPPVENTDNNSSNEETNQPVVPSNNTNDDLTGETNNPVLTGGNDSVNFPVNEVEPTKNQLNGNTWHNFQDIFNSSWLGNSINNENNYEAIGIEVISDFSVEDDKQIVIKEQANLVF